MKSNLFLPAKRLLQANEVLHNPTKIFLFEAIKTVFNQNPYVFNQNSEFKKSQVCDL